MPIRHGLFLTTWAALSLSVQLATASGGHGMANATGESSALAAESKAVVTFSGLRTYDDGSSTLRVDLTQQVTVKLKEQQGKKLVFLLEGAKVELRNNKNPLRAEYFNSNVVRTQLKDSKEGVLVEIELRKEVRPEYKLLKHAGGAILRIDIPPAQ